MSEEPSGPALDVTLQDFSSGQKVFNRYTLIRVLGRGGMGIVWLAHDEVLDRDVALKFLPEIIVHERAILEDLKRETKRSLELTHKNIIRIHDFVYDVMSACISMEYIEGDTLSNLRADKATRIFEPDELKPWLRQLCDALDYAHNHARIIHRDLKPSNLMISARGQLKVADFGIARSLSDSVSMLTHTKSTSGTLVYMSPQQLDGLRGTHLDDIYSLGATLYELLTSKPPFYTGDIARQIHQKIPLSITERRKDLEVEGNPIPENWEETIAACMAKDPAFRPQTIAELAARFGLRAPSEAQPPAPTSSDDARVKDQRRVGRRSLGNAATMAVLLIAGAIGYFLIGRDHVGPSTPVVPEIFQATPNATPSATETTVTQQNYIPIPTGYSVLEFTASPNHRFGVITPDADHFIEGAFQHQIVELPTGRTVGLIQADTGFVDSKVQMGRGGINPARWSEDGTVLLWEVEGRWSPRALVLLKIADAGTTIKWQIDLLKSMQREILSRTKQAAPNAYLKAMEWNKGSGSAFPDGFVVNVRADSKQDVPLNFPIHVHARLTSNPKQIPISQGAVDLNSELDEKADERGKLSVSGFHLTNTSGWEIPALPETTQNVPGMQPASPAPATPAKPKKLFAGTWEGIIQAKEGKYRLRLTINKDETEVFMTYPDIPNTKGPIADGWSHRGPRMLVYKYTGGTITIGENEKTARFATGNNKGTIYKKN